MLMESCRQSLLLTPISMQKLSASKLRDKLLGLPVLAADNKMRFSWVQ